MIKETPKDLVPTFFNNTSNSYDDIVHWTTFGKDSLWKHKILEQLSDEKTVLDLACGTGILTKQIAKKLPQAKITGVDITKNYLEKATETDYSMPGIYIIFSTLLNYLDKHSPDPVLVFALEIKMLNELGIAPSTTGVGLPKYTSNLIKQLGCLTWNNISELKLNRNQVMAITGILENHITQNLYSIPKARASALSL